MFQFGRISNRRMSHVNEYLVLTAKTALTKSPIDMTIPWMGGYRTALEQNSIFDRGYSKCDGVNKISFHQSGNALDVAPYVDGAMNNDSANFELFAPIMLQTFKDLQESGEIPEDLHLHWGGFWSAKDNNNDGFLSSIEDKFGWDRPHWELRSKPQRNVLKFKPL